MPTISLPSVTAMLAADMPPVPAPSRPPTPAVPQYLTLPPWRSFEEAPPRLCFPYMTPSYDSQVVLSRVSRGSGFEGRVHIYLKPGAIEVAKARIKQACAQFRGPWNAFKREFGQPEPPPLPPPTEAVERARRVLKTYVGYDWTKPLAQITAIALGEKEEYFREFIQGAGEFRCRSRSQSPNPPPFALLLAKNHLDSISLHHARQVYVLPYPLRPGEPTAMGSHELYANHTEQRDRIYLRMSSDYLRNDYPDAYVVASDEDVDQLFTNLDMPENRTMILEPGDRERGCRFIYDLFRTR